MTVGVGGAGAVGIGVETVMGTYVAPTIWVPILNETLSYSEERYISPAIQGKTIASAVKLGYYHAEGDIDWEVDTQWLPYFLHSCRLSVVKSGSGPYNYIYKLASGASSGIGGGAATLKTLSITILRNAKVWKYVGCVCPQYAFRIEDGQLKATMSVMGLGETGTNADSPPSTSFTTRKLLGADAHTLYTDAAGSAPAFASPNNDYNGYTLTINDNGAAQNRIRPSRQASYISFGETEVELTTQLDMQDRTEIDNFVAATGKAVKLVSSNDPTNDRVQLITFNNVYTQNDVHLSSIGDIVMADVTMRSIDQATSGAFQIIVDSVTNLT